MLKGLLFLLLIAPFFGSAQDSTKVNSVYIEAGGTGAYGSLGFERVFPFSNKWTLGSRIGISTLNLFDFNNKFNPDLIFPLTISIYYGKTHQTELGLSNTFTGINEFTNSEVQRNWSSNGALILGYRFNARRNPLFAKCFYSPMFVEYKRFIHWGGLSLGFRF